MKPIIFSGMQPTGVPSLGNFIGAIQNWVQLQDDYRCIYCVVDMHSLTVRQDPEELRRKARELLILYIALGVDPDKSIIYFQSQLPQHAELAWILNCFTYMGELGRMTQFKEKSARHEDNINAGLFTYPVLMAADILLFKTALVPIGDDQKQHLELCRDVAMRFNNLFGDTFVIPEAYYGKVGARVMSLQEPERKMSKSETVNINNVIYLLDSPDEIMKKFKKAKTDSGSEICFSPDKPGVSNLLTIYSALTKKSESETEKDFEGLRYGDLKRIVGETVIDALSPVQKRFEELKRETDYNDKLIANNREQGYEMAEATLKDVKKKVGLYI